MRERVNTEGSSHRAPLVDFGFGSSFSAAGLGSSVESSVRAFFLLGLPVPPTSEGGRFPLVSGGEKDIISVGGVPMVSDPWEEGEDRLWGRER